MNIEKAKSLCRSLPGATEDIKWGADLVFSVGEKMFAVAGDCTAKGGISFKVDDDRFLELTDRQVGADRRRESRQRQGSRGIAAAFVSAGVRQTDQKIAARNRRKHR